MRLRFQKVEQAISYDGKDANFKWKYNDKLLNEKQVTSVAKIAKYGIGNGSKGTAWIDMGRNYNYTLGEQPWIIVEDNQQHVENVLEHEWRVQYMSPEFLKNYFEKAMGTKTFTEQDKTLFTSRHKCEHPDEYRIPQFILNQPMGPQECKTFKDGWKDPSVIAKAYAHRKNPWARQFNYLSIQNKEHRPERMARKRKRQDA